ncbi:MAG: carboxypeptidase regulatory-like domain-containing protein [Fibrobacterota bacterium]|nr:MAG: carboxypeptidase regulatory-like domain-containing protein [Fibrobacterota bacterium]
MVVLRYIGLFFVLGMLSGCESGGSAVGSSSGASRDSSGARAISGQVVDDAGLPVDQATVSAYGVVSQSGPDGKFVLKGISSIPARIVVQADKEGFFPATAGSQAGTSQMPFVIVSLAKKQLLGVVSNGAGGELGTGAIKIKCQPESFAGSSTDTIAVYTSYVDPTPGANTARMPGGDFTAINSGTDTGSMISFGAMQLSIEDKSGNPVAIKKPLSTCLAIPASMAATAPDSIPLWVAGMGGVWLQAGIARKVGDEFCFELSASGAINCDLFSRTVQVQGKVCQDTKGNPASKERVTIGQLTTYTDADGRYSALVPAVSPIQASSRFGINSSSSIAGVSLTLDLGCFSGGPRELLGEWTHDVHIDATRYNLTFFEDGNGWSAQAPHVTTEDPYSRRRIQWSYADGWLKYGRRLPDTLWISLDSGATWQYRKIELTAVPEPELWKISFKNGNLLMEARGDWQGNPGSFVEEWTRP